MKFPKMNRRRQASVTIPQLNGGINTRDNLSAIGDNQLTAVSNMWYHKGALRTRPGLYYTNNIAVNTTKPHTQLRQVLDEETTLSISFNETADSDNYTVGVTSVLINDPDDKAFRKNKSAFGSGCNVEAYPTPTAFGTKTKTGLLLYFCHGKIKTLDRASSNEGYGDYGDISPYVPTVMMNGYGKEAETTEDSKASAYEDYNMLTRAFKCQFTTDGTSKTFILPTNNLGTKEGTDTIVAILNLTLYNRETQQLNEYYISLTNKYGRTTIMTAKRNGVVIAEDDRNNPPTSFPLENSWGELDLYHGDGTEVTKAELTVDFDFGSGTLYFESYVEKTKDGNTSYEYGNNLPRVANNNLTVTAWRATEWDSEIYTICRMTKCTWFGGERSGIHSGTRLFVCGNPAEPNLIHWSGTNDPLFFPELNRARIGDKSQAVTGFGKQGDVLVIFKERQIYAAQYVAGEDDDYSFAKENGVPIDTYTAKFPVSPVHSFIGCDCPNTIRLVNNRLVWMDSTGRVFMLTGTGQYSERNVREISQNIRSLLTAHSKEELRNAVGGELEGYYLLLVGKKIYALDTQMSGFANYSYYSDEEKAQKGLSWYVWDLPEQLEYTGMVSNGNTLRITTVIHAQNGDGNPVDRHDVHTAREDEPDQYSMKSDGTRRSYSIPCSFTTKLFDFGQVDTRKAVEQLYLDVADIPGGEIKVSYLTESSVAEDACTIVNRGDAAEQAPGYVRTVRLTPNIHRAKQFGLRLTSEGSMAVENIIIKTRQQGVVR